MSFLRYAFDDFNRPLNLFDQHFGLGLLNDDLYQPLVSPVMLGSGYYRPWRHLSRQQSGTSSLQSDKSGFKVSLDVQQFQPDEVSVKNVDGGVVVEGKHEEKQDAHGYISRHFVRRYVLPENVDADKIECKLSSDGVLTITAPNKVNIIYPKITLLWTVRYNGFRRNSERIKKSPPTFFKLISFPPFSFLLIGSVNKI
jgi:crystallin alpha B